MVGGRTNHWGRISLRFGPDDFKRKSIDGLGDDWPIGYDDVKPYYDKIDKLIGVFGTNENFYNAPGRHIPAATKTEAARAYAPAVKREDQHTGYTFALINPHQKDQ